MIKKSVLDSQIPLAFGYRETADFDQFIEGVNSEACKMCKLSVIGSQAKNIYLWGPAKSGKSHLLQAMCQFASQQGLNAALVPLKQQAELSPTMLEGLENLEPICIDDIEYIAGRADWEQALLHLYNRLQAQNRSVLVAGSTGPQDLPLQLPDLRSRIGGNLTYQLHPLDDAGKIQVLQKRAEVQSFELPDQVANYLVRNVRRDLPFLLSLLDQFSQATLREKRKLTLSFVRSLIKEKA